MTKWVRSQGHRAIDSDEHHKRRPAHKHARRHVQRTLQVDIAHTMVDETEGSLLGRGRAVPQWWDAEKSIASAAAAAAAKRYWVINYYVFLFCVVFDLTL